MILKNTLTKRAGTLAVLVSLFLLSSTGSLQAKLVEIKASTKWSDIKTGSGTNGVPNKNDDIWVYNGDKKALVILTIDQNAEAASLKLGDFSGTPSTGGISISSGKTFDVFGTLDAPQPNNFGGQGLYNTIYLNSGSFLNVMGENNTHYSINGPGTYNNSWTGTPLPVDLISFSAVKQNNTTAVLNFATAWEINNAGFEVERSTNGVSWSKIGFVAGKGNSTEINNYTFSTSLVNVNTPVVYYRLKQVDFNGQFEYSATRTLRLNGAAATTANVYPNPATSKISVSLEGMAAGEMARITVMDMSGKAVISSNQIVQEGNFTMDMNIDNLKTGNYIINITSPSANFNTKLVKL